MKKVLIVCIGNQLVADDGIGQVIYQELCHQEIGTGVRLLFLGLGGIDLIEELQGEDLLVVVDGVQLGGKVGDVVELEWDQLPVAQGRPVSGHGIGLRDAIDVTRTLYSGRCPARVVLVGVEGGCFDRLGVGLSDEVLVAIPKAVDLIVDLASR